MDDACGPSNAFKGLTRHVEQDRSLQQDRVAGNNQVGSSSQSFRSTPANAAATGQFTSFQQGAPLNQFSPSQNQLHQLMPPHFSPLTHHSPTPAHINPLSPQTSVPSPSNWVHDFQNFNLSETSQANPHHHINPSFNPSFNLAHNHHQQQQQLNNRNLSSQGFTMGCPLFVNPPPAEAAPQNQSAEQQAAQWDQEFEGAMAEWMAVNGPTEAEAAEALARRGQRSDAQLQALQEEQVAAAATTATAAAEAATAEAAEKEAEQTNETGNTELSQAAQQLVDSLADNVSDKFQNSEFLALMRRIASQEVTVQGNDLVEASQPPNTDS